MAPALTEPHRPRATQTNLTRKRPSYVRIFFMVLQYDVGSHSKNFLPPFSRCFLTGSLTRNSSTDLTDFKTRNEKRKVYNALAAASIFKNSAGVDTSHRQVVPMDAFLHFLSHFQKEHLSEEEANQLIEVGKTFFHLLKSLVGHEEDSFSQCLKITQKVSFYNIASEIPQNVAFELLNFGIFHHFLSY